MTLNRFEDLISWQKAQDLAIYIYNHFSNLKDYSFKDQVCRASISVSNNIAEGFDRGSDQEFIRFLFIAKASNSEVKSMLYLAQKLNFIDELKFNEGINLCNDVGKLINGLISYLIKSKKVS
jgi:four helix bundle protein